MDGSPTAAPELAARRGPPTSGAVHDLSVLQFVFFKIDPYGPTVVPSAFLHQEDGIARWVQQQTGTELQPLISPAALAARFRRDGSELGWHETIFQGPAELGAAPSPVVMVNCWHDIASWLLVASRLIARQPRLLDHVEVVRSQFAEMVHGLWRPQIDVPEEVIGETIVLRVTTHGERSPAATQDICTAWLQALAVPRGEDGLPDGRLLHAQLIHRRADCWTLLPAPGAPEGRGDKGLPETWWSLQVCDTADEPELDDVTVNDLRRMEGYGHKISRLVRDYDYLHRYLVTNRAVLSEEIDFWLHNFPVREARSAGAHSRMRKAMRGYYELSRVASEAREEQISLRLNLANLDRHRSAIDEGGAADQVYAYHSGRGHTAVRQIDGDLDYIDTVLRQTDTILRASETNLAHERQELETSSARVFSTLLLTLSIVQLWGLVFAVHDVTQHSWLGGSPSQLQLDGIVLGTLVAALVVGWLLWSFIRWLKYR